MSKKYRLRTQIFIVFSLLMCSVCICVGLLLFYHVKHEKVKQFIETNVASLKNFAQLNTTNFIIRDYHELTNNLNSFIFDRGVLQVVVRDMRNEIVCLRNYKQQNILYMMKDLKFDSRMNSLYPNYEITKAELFKNSVYIFKHEIYNELTLDYVGSMELIASPRHTLQDIQQQKAILLGAAVLFLLICCLLIYFLSNVLIKQIKLIEGFFKNTPKDTLREIDAKIISSPEFNGFIANYNGMVQEVKKHQDQVNQMERLASIGQMTAEIAHDIKRPFTTIDKILELLPKKTNDPEFIEKNKRSIKEAQANVNALLNDLMEYSKGNEITKIKTHLHELMRSIVKSIELHYGEELRTIELLYQSEFDAALSVDIIKLQRAITNIIHNAIEVLKDYESGEKSIRIETSRGKNKEDTDCLYITIANTGPAIDEEFLKEIFEPFKTKGKRNGTGLGLAIAKNVLGAHEGDLTVHTNIDGNVSFRLELPITKDALIQESLELRAQGSEASAVLPDTEEDISISPPPPKEYSYEARKLGTVLVIDDDSIARDAVRSLIEKDEEFGHLEVIEAEDGEEVLNLIEKHGVGYIVSDFQLGKHKLNGMGVLEKVKIQNKKIRVLLMSSFRTSDQSFEALTKGAVDFVTKPVCRGHIRTLVEH